MIQTPDEKNVLDPPPNTLVCQVLLGQDKVGKASDEEREHEDKAERLHSIPVQVPPGQSGG